MNDKGQSRRLVLQQLASMTALGALGMLRAASIAAQSSSAPGSTIPGIAGKIIRREDKNYEIWRQSMVWHLSKPKRYPDIIVQAQSEQDVIGAVNYAAKQGLKVAVRSGGHNSVGPSLRDGGLLIDVSAMDNIQIDESAQIAVIQPGVRSLQLVTAARGKG